MRNLKAAVAMCLMGPALASSAPAPWLEVKSPHFSVVTNSGEKVGRRMAWQFEQVRQALLVVWPWATIDGGRPITIFAVRDETALKSLGPQYWEGKRYRPTSFWASGPDRQYVAVRTDVAEPDDVGENPYQSAYWNYVSLVFHRSVRANVPVWYSRGLTAVLSNTVVRDKEIHVGRPIGAHLREVRSGTYIAPDAFFATLPDPRYRSDEIDAYRFDSQAWAFVHFLMFGSRGEHSARINRFNQLLVSGAAAEAAMNDAFGSDMKPYFDGMRSYIQQEVFQYGRIPVALEVKSEGFASRPVDVAEAASLRANMLVAMGRPVEARAAAAEAAKADPNHAGPFEIEGALMDRESKPDDAKSAYARAAEMGSKRAQVYYRLAQLNRPPQNADPAESAKLAGTLQRAIELDPEFANALSYLAEIKTDLGQADEAIGLAQRAIKAEPDSSYHRTALARALWSAGQPDRAMEAARSALRLAETADRRAQIQRFLNSMASSARPPAPPAPSPLNSPEGLR